MSDNVSGVPNSAEIGQLNISRGEKIGKILAELVTSFLRNLDASFIYLLFI